jgi:PTS system nitrogen regulatory IIA component
VLAEMVALACLIGGVRETGPLLDLLALRERLGSTAIGKGVALPNARSATVIRPQLIVARSRRGVEWSAPDGSPIFLILMVLSPSEWSAAGHHALLGRAAAVARLQRNRQKLLDAPSFDVVAQVLAEVAS